MSDSTSKNWRFFGRSENQLWALFQKLQESSSELKGGNVVTWTADGKTETIQITKDLTGDQYMREVFNELQVLNPTKYGQSTDRTIYQRNRSLGTMGVENGIID